jgi:putative spermidine/putrescine transport system ATP-binding protein
VRAVVTDVEYMGSYRTAVLALGSPGVKGRARIDAFDSTLTRGDDVVAWWLPQRQRVVAA